jgi:hypothetical protein
MKMDKGDSFSCTNVKPPHTIFSNTSAAPPRGGAADTFLTHFKGLSDPEKQPQK